MKIMKLAYKHGMYVRISDPEMETREREIEIERERERGVSELLSTWLRPPLNRSKAPTAT